MCEREVRPQQHSTGLCQGSVLSSAQARQRIRKGEHKGPTSGLAPGRLQLNLVILEADKATQFRNFCKKNSKPCPLLFQSQPGEARLGPLGEGDVRVDLPLYNVYQEGKLVEQTTDVTAHFDENMCAFYLGCSFSFELALVSAGIPVRNLEEGKNVSMYKTNVRCNPHGHFEGPVVVSMRPIRKDLVSSAVEITSRFPHAHGAPFHIGDPSEIGITDLGKVDFGEAVEVREGEVPVFWACGVTSALAALSHPNSGKIITHAPGHMLIADIGDEEGRLLHWQLLSQPRAG